jgi:hypothetical protein
MGLPVAGQHVWAALRIGEHRVLLIGHFINEMAGRFLAYEGPIETRGHQGQVHDVGYGRAPPATGTSITVLLSTTPFAATVRPAARTVGTAESMMRHDVPACPQPPPRDDT